MEKQNYSRKIRILVAHPFQQHSFQTFIALSQSGFDVYYATTVYLKKKSLTGFVLNFLNNNDRKRALTRRLDGDYDDRVLQFSEMWGLLLLLISRVDKTRKLYSMFSRFVVDSFNRKVYGHLVKENYDIVISYDMNSYVLFKLLHLRNIDIIKILDMSAPNRCFVRDIKYQASLEQKSSGVCLNDIVEDERANFEISNADYFFVASKFTERSLFYQNIDKKKIFFCRYGINQYFFNSEYIERRNNILNCVFVGNVTINKGFPFLYEAIKHLGDNTIELSILGNYDENDEWYKYKLPNMHFHGHLTKDKVKEVLLRSDVLVFPSLADGFGFSVVEAMSCGVVPIVSRNAGVSDLIQNYVNGLIIEPFSSDEIKGKIEFLINNPTELKRMSREAFYFSKEIGWDKYRADLENAFLSINKSGSHYENI